jgi:malonate transporter MadL subunit
LGGLRSGDYGRAAGHAIVGQAAGEFDGGIIAAGRHARLADAGGRPTVTIYGVALLAICTLLGGLAGEALGQVLGAKTNVGGVGIAMLLLIAARHWLARGWRLDGRVRAGVGFWGGLYIPIVVAMAASQNVVAAIASGPMVILAASLAVASCLAVVAIIARLAGPTETMDEIEAREVREALALAAGAGAP